MIFDLPADAFDVFGTRTLDMRRVPCAVCSKEFWVPDTHVGPFVCSVPCAEQRVEQLNQPVAEETRDVVVTEPSVQSAASPSPR